MKIAIKSNTEKPIDATSLLPLYANAGWWSERSEQDVNQMLQSAICVGAWEGDRLIGFARAISDGRFRAYVEDVVIHTTYQRTGIGRDLVKRLLDALSDIDVVSLFCDEAHIPFYQENGFKFSKSQHVMHMKKK